MTNEGDNEKYDGTVVNPLEKHERGDDANDPYPTILSWEDIESGKSGQLSLPGLIPVPTVGERAFLLLARQWYKEILSTDKSKTLPISMDYLGLASILLAVEWGRDFTNVARDQIDINREAIKDRGVLPWVDQISWQICQASLEKTPSKSETVEQLIANLDHHNSSIRCWMLEIGWFIRHWLDASKAIPLLLKNIADTIFGPFMSAGLAAGIAVTEEEFCALAQEFNPPSNYEAQYRDRMKQVEELGILEIQSHFWKLETECWKVISQTVLGQRLGIPPVTKVKHVKNE